MKNYRLALSIAMTILGSVLISAQSLGLASGGQTLMNEAAGAFPYVAGFIFIFVAFKNMDHFTSKGGDVWEGVKNIGIYLLLVLVIVGAYQFIKSKAL